MSYKDKLLLLKNNIELASEKRNLPLATLLDIMNCFNELLRNKITSTIKSETIGFFRNFDFIKSKISGIGWVISL